MVQCMPRCFDKGERIIIHAHNISLEVKNDAARPTRTTIAPIIFRNSISSLFPNQNMKNAIPNVKINMLKDITLSVTERPNISSNLDL